MFCPVCGQSLRLEDNFCIRCGAPSARERLEPAAAAASTSTASSRAPIDRAPSTTEEQRALEGTSSSAFQPAVEPVLEKPRPDAPGELPEDAAPDFLPELSAVPDAVISKEQDQVAPQTAPEFPRPVEERSEPGVSPRERRAPDVAEAAPAIAPTTEAVPKPGEPKIAEELVYNSCGTDLSAGGSALTLGPADIPTPSFGGYAVSAGKPARGTSSSKGESNRTAKMDAARVPSKKASPSSRTPGKKSRLPVLEILVSVLLVAGAGAAVWMLRSSLPSKTAAPASTVSVTISPVNTEVRVGKACDFVAAVTGTDDTRVTWTVQEGSAGGRFVTRGAEAESDAASSRAVYIAPDAPGTYHVLATSKADPKRSAAAVITVVSR